MIDFHYELDFVLNNEIKYSDWITRVINEEDASVGQLNYVFCDDSYLLSINQQYLCHDTFTDIITFDYTVGIKISGDIFISIDRVQENASEYEVLFLEELARVMVHGVLHLLGYEDKSAADRNVMRQKENDAMELFHVEQ